MYIYKKRLWIQRSQVRNTVSRIHCSRNKDDELYVFVNIYRSPNSTDDNSLKLHNLLLEVSETKKYKHKILCGDINYKKIDWQHMVCTASVNSLDFSSLEATRDAYLTQHIDCPTMGRGSDKPSTLDLLLTDQEANIAEIQIDSPLGKSDLALISATLFCYFPVPNRTKISYQYDKANFEEMQKILMIDCETVLNDCSTEINKMWEIFLNKMKEVENMIPKKVIKNNNKKGDRTPLDRKSLSKIKRKDRLWERYCKTSDGKIYLEYCKARNQVRRITRKAQKLF